MHFHAGLSGTDTQHARRGNTLIFEGTRARKWTKPKVNVSRMSKSQQSARVAVVSASTKKERNKGGEVMACTATINLRHMSYRATPSQKQIRKAVEILPLEAENILEGSE